MPKAKEADDFGDIFSSENIPKSNYFKFEKVGEKVAGILVEVKDKPAKEPFPAQRVYGLKQPDGVVTYVGISLNKDYVIGRANTAKMGDILGFEYKKDIPSATKGFAAAKSIEVYVKHLENQEASDDAF